MATGDKTNEEDFTEETEPVQDVVAPATSGYDQNTGTFNP